MYSPYPNKHHIHDVPQSGSLRYKSRSHTIKLDDVRLTTKARSKHQVETYMNGQSAHSMHVRTETNKNSTSNITVMGSDGMGQTRQVPGTATTCKTNAYMLQQMKKNSHP